MIKILSALFLSFLLLKSPVLLAGVKEKKEVNLYSYRQEFLLRPFLNAFTKRTGIKVNVVFMKKGLLQRLKAEGIHSPADVILTVDIGHLELLSELKLLKKIKSKIVEENIPVSFRDPKGYWIGLSARARVLYYSKERVKISELKSYDDLAGKKFKGKICSRSGLHSYNLGLLSSIVYHHGEKYALSWAKNVRANLARSPQGNDRGQVKAISEGLCDLAIGNTYYMGKMLENPKQRNWAASAGIFFPNQESTGSHINITGAGIVKSSKNKESALKLVEFLTNDLAQHMYAQVNHEYPLKNGVGLSGIVKSFGGGQKGIENGFFKKDVGALLSIAKLRTKAIKIMNQAGFD
jgi:iron(III) transport system substrate-binding protein